MWIILLDPEFDLDRRVDRISYINHIFIKRPALATANTVSFAILSS